MTHERRFLRIILDVRAIEKVVREHLQWERRTPQRLTVPCGAPTEGNENGHEKPFLDRLHGVRRRKGGSRAFRLASRSVYDAAIIQFPRIFDDRGNLTFIESRRHLPFDIARVYWIYDVPGGESRGSHAYRTLHEVIIALSGSFEVFLDDGMAQKTVMLNRAYYGLYVPNLIWRRMQHFSTNAVALVLASKSYDLNDYVRDYEEFQRVNQRT